MPPKILFRLGLSLFVVATATYLAAGRWLNSRIFTPLDYSVSLDNRQLKSPPFEINLRETYFASLDLDYSVDDWYQDNRCNYKTILYPPWRVYRLGSASVQSRELWVSSEQLTYSDVPFLMHSLLLPANISWSGIFLQPRRASILGIRTFRSLPIPLVYIRTPAQFVVNGEEVDRSDLRSKLTERLGRRWEWSVYFEADADTRYMDAVYAIDVIQGCGAKLIWVTPKMREHWRHTPESSPKN
jgi:hypothetical protein